MFTKIIYKNCRAIVDATLELSPVTLLVGPNGSGKTTVIESFDFKQGLTPTIGSSQETTLVDFYINPSPRPFIRRSVESTVRTIVSHTQEERDISERLRTGGTIYAFNAMAMRQPVTISGQRNLTQNADNLSGFLDYIRDNDSDSFVALTKAIYKSTSEFDDIGFDGVANGQKRFKLRRAGTRDFIPAPYLSEGTLYLVAFLALAYQPVKPAVLCLEEPDRGLHPRLYREIRDVLYRLAYPQEYGYAHDPVQIIATTHSPYFLNEFSDKPEQVVVCEKDKNYQVTFKNLAKDANARSILEDTLIGDAWATGALGGVPERK